MKKYIIPIMMLSSYIGATEITATIQYPKEQEHSNNQAGKRTISRYLKPLVLYLQNNQKNDFITSRDASSLEWKGCKITIIDENIIAVSYDEGHIIVTGVLVRNVIDKQWNLVAESGGKFKYRSYSQTSGKPIIETKE